MNRFKIILILIAFLFAYNSLGQTFDGFRYLHVKPLVYQDGRVDTWGVCAQVEKAFEEKGFTILTQDEIQSPSSKEVVFQTITCSITHTNHPVNTVANTVNIRFSDFEGHVVYVCDGGSWASSFQRDMTRATDEALQGFRKMKYHFNPALTPRPSYSNVETLNWSEDKLRAYYDSNNIDAIEGIYKTAPGDNSDFYRLGIIKIGYKYKAVVLESDNAIWEPGEVKAVFEPANLGLYSVSWYLGNKKKTEVFGEVDSYGILTVNLTKTVGVDAKFLKVYPIQKVSSKKTGFVPTPSDIKSKKPVGSGSGFFISKNGFIATNAHVVTGSKGLTVDVLDNNGVSQRYIADVVYIDQANDVAIIKVNDEEFCPLKDLPYTIEANANIGADVFTIGFPLARKELMGNNFKVTNGIISAKTGVGDDVRHYQITVPIQSGNSGGPLFNKDGNVVGLTTSSLSEEYVNEKSIKPTRIENVNYAVKSLYLLAAINALPSFDGLTSNNGLEGKTLEEQIDVLKNYICLILVY